MRNALSLSSILVAIGVVAGCSPNDSAPRAKEVKVEDAKQILGSYSLRGTNPDDSQAYYVGTVTVSEDGEGLKVVQQIQGMTWSGEGNIDPQGRLFVVFAESNVEGTWTLLEDGTLDGTWKESGQSAAGTEVWSPVGR